MGAGLRQDPAKRPGTVLAAVSACTVLVVAFVASINLAVPDLAASVLRPSSSQLLWIVDAYVVFFACLVVPAGALGDRLGRKGVLVSGLLVFAAGALVSATAGDVAVMVAGRVICGVGAAGVLPNGLGVLIHATPAARRSRAVAVWAAMTGAGGVVGNVGGGALLQIGSWRLLFAAVAPVAAACAAWIAVAAPRSDHHDRTLEPRSAALLTLAVLALLAGIVQGPDQGWSSWLVIGAFVAAVGLGAAWVVTELRSEQPLLDPRLFRIPQLRAACLGMLVVFFAMFGFFFVNASLMQYGRGFTVLETGLAIVPMTLPLLVGAQLVPRVVARVGERAVLAAAFVLSCVGLFGLADAIDHPYPVYAVWLVVLGAGIALALPTLTITISAALPPRQAGVGGGLQATTRELGSALGVAVIGTLLSSRFLSHLSRSGAGHSRSRSVAEALAAQPHDRSAVLSAYTGAAGSAIRTVAVIAAIAGALVIAEMTWAGRGRRASTSETAPPTPSAQTVT